MATKSDKSRTRETVIYTLQPSKAGRATFSDVRLPNGTIIRRVDESVHRRALRNVARAAREKAS